MSYALFKPGKQRLNKKKIWGFDIETYNKNKSFLMCSLWHDDDENYQFFNKEDFIRAIKNGVFNNSIIVATNLGFDFFGTFFGSKETKNFNFLFRGSDLLYVRTYAHKGKLHKKNPQRTKCSITFLDTLNYAQMGVEKLGKLIGENKMPSPKFIGKKPKNKREMDYMIKYNLQDAKVSALALQFFYDSFEKLGATPKLTLASTAMSLFRNRYLKNEYWRHDEKILLEQFKGYYGGRTEALYRGLIEDLNYYDFNSLYPSVMLEKFPDPNTLRITYQDSLHYIETYEGMSEVSVRCPPTDYPLLPFRMKEKDCESSPFKLIFPTGTFRGYYTHIEIREAIAQGYEIKKVHKTFYYKKTCYPFKKFVEDMYEQRLEYKAQNSPMEKVVKIIMNGLYGKFGQKFQDKDNLIPFNHTAEDLMKYKSFEIIGDGEYLRIKEDRMPASFCIPIWAAYVTAYGRIKLNRAMHECKPVYVDTDSLLTKNKLPESNKLGDLKLELKIAKGVIVKPKFYAVTDVKGETMVKIKGVGTKIVFNDFGKLLINPEISYTKFLKIKESLRRGLIPNEITDITKKLNLDDNKRVWDGEFNQDILTGSKPIHLEGGKIADVT